MEIDSNYNNLPPWVETIGKISRIIPNVYRLKYKILMILINKIRGKNYRTIIKYDLGQKIILNLDDWISLQLFLCGTYLMEKKETKFFKKIVKRDYVVIDIGANIGYYTLMAAARVGEKGKVYSFEPSSSTFRILKENININNFKNVRLIKMAFSDRTGKVKLYQADKTNIGATSIGIPKNFSGTFEEVKCIGLDEFIQKEEIKRVDVIKIDVEGAEVKVLNGMKKLLSTQNPKVLIEIKEEMLNQLGYHKEDVYNFFKNYRYIAYDIKNSKIIKTPTEGDLILFYKENKTR